MPNSSRQQRGAQPDGDSTTGPQLEGPELSCLSVLLSLGPCQALDGEWQLPDSSFLCLCLSHSQARSID